MWTNRIEPNAKELKLHPVSEGKESEGRGVDVHLIDDPAARLGLELGAPVASGGGGGVRVDATGGSDGYRVGPLRGAPVGGAVHGLRPGRLTSSFSLEI